MYKGQAFDADQEWDVAMILGERTHKAVKQVHARARV